MINLAFQAYLSIWQRIPANIQNKIVERFKFRFNPDNLRPDLPMAATIDPINVCNLDCPLCASKNQDYDKGKMSLDTFKMILAKIPSLKVLVLFNWGESLLYHETLHMIKASVSRNIYTVVHTNFSFIQKPEFFEQLIDSGLHLLVISADGATQETYEQYRINGRLDWVIENIKMTVRTKKRLKKRDPKIVWKFIINKFNEHEIDRAKKLAKELGVEITFDKMGLADDIPDLTFAGTLEERKKKWLPANSAFVLDYYRNGNKPPINDQPCDQLFNSPVINPDGKVTPCCWVTSRENVWGDLTKESFEDIWYNDKYVYSRSLFSNLEYNGKTKHTVCTDCEIFRRVK
jgi:radical SAM protein with 4Fe4S-binding SPASM domain